MSSSPVSTQAVEIAEPSPEVAGLDLAAARRVLQLEAEGVQALSAALDGRFAAAVELLVRVAGRVVVSGIGKSGHVARKIAATLASTGTPAIWVHASEASHGDLGMVTPQDAVLLLSNSGETAELRDLVAYAKRFAIPLIGIVGRAGSNLAEAADIALVLPATPEACPLGLAPTTSTTAMLALGDALAVALMRRRGFSAEDFQVLHPGGKLGRVLVRVEDIMHGADELPLIGPDAGMSSTILRMTEKRFGCVGVVDGEGRLVGIVTDGDLRRHIGDALLEKRVEQVMTRSPKTIRPKALAAEALGRMNAGERPITCLFVVEQGKPVGIVHIHDCLRAGIA
jgi:arabinose-5-phosphate isomerase